jgi:hypothetical protein
MGAAGGGVVGASVCGGPQASLAVDEQPVLFAFGIRHVVDGVRVEDPVGVVRVVFAGKRGAEPGVGGQYVASARRWYGIAFLPP